MLSREMTETVTIEDFLRTWINALSDQVAVSASRVQDGLIDLWGMLDDGDVRTGVEDWLTETLQRNLYTTDEVVTRIQELFDLEVVL
jgi:hypothetical protein